MTKLLTLLTALTLLIPGLACDGNSNNTNNANNVNNVNNVNNTNNTNNTNNGDGPHLVSYDHTGCKDQEKTIDFGLFTGFECVVWTYDGAGALELRHVNALFNCCPNEALGLTGEVAFADGVFTLTESDNGGDCRCMCRYDLVYQLSGVVPGAYEVVVAPFANPVALDLSAAVEGWSCIDRLGSPEYMHQGGGRGASCGESSECMGGDGYCFAIPDLFSVCVDACETVLDCPQPDLEECVEDTESVSFCRPLTAF